MPTRAIDLHLDGPDTQLFGRLRLCGARSPGVVLLSGVGFHTFEYEPLAELLAERQIATLSLDFRGHGDSDGQRGDWTLKELAADASVAVDGLQQRCGGPVAVCGNNLGGMVAMSVGVANPQVAGVIASNCPAHIDAFLMTPARRMALRIAHWFRNVPRLRLSLRHLYSHERLIDRPEWLQAIDADPRIADARRLTIGTYEELFAWNGERAARRLTAPLLVLQGEHDQLQPPHESQLLFAAAHEPKEYRTVPTGHLPHVEDPALVADLVCDWMETISAPDDESARN